MPKPPVIATAGWSIPRLHAQAFPAEGSALERYSRVLRGVEINSTFWRAHRTSTFQRWFDVTPRDFRFALKLPRTISHEARLLGARRLLEEFFAAVAPLGHKLGPLLLQLPPSFAFDPRRVGAFLRLLRALHEGPVACEPRHPSWLAERAEELLVRHGIARVAADPARAPGLDRPGGARSLVYFRLHGSPVVYRSAYGEERLRAYAEQLRAAHAAEAWCVFDNTASGAGAGDAVALARMVGALR